MARGDRTTVRGVAIIWTRSDRMNELTHGTVGGLRCFTLRPVYRGEELTIHLPGKYGPREIETHKTPSDAKRRAGAILKEILDAIDEASALSVGLLPDVDLESAS